MAVILQQLPASIPHFPTQPFNRKLATWSFKQQLNRQSNHFWVEVINNRPRWMALYRVQCSYLITLANEPSTPEPQLLEEIEATLVLAELLEQTYQRLNETQDINQLRQDQRLLRRLMRKQYPSFASEPELTLIPTPNILHAIRSHMTSANWYRLVALRLRRLTTYALLLKSFRVFYPWMNALEPMLGPFFLYLGWVFFIPRLSVNLLILLKHTIPNPWMPERERHLPFFTRLAAQLNLHRRGFELSNDLMWFISGILTCFVLVGPLVPYRLILTIVLQFFDLATIVVRAGLELSRLHWLENEYQQGVLQGKISPNPDYLTALRARRAYEYRFHGLALVNNLILVLAILTLVPMVVAFNPILPVLGALAALGASTLMAIEGARVQTARPPENLNCLHKHRLFQPPHHQQEPPHAPLTPVLQP